MVLCIGVQQPTDHALILGAVLLGFALEELDASFGKGDCDLYPFVAQYQLLGLRKKVRDDFQFSQRLVRVADFRAHRFVCLCASSRRQ